MSALGERGPGAGRRALPDPAPLIELSTAYWQAQVLLTANRIGLFAALGARAATPAELAVEMGMAERPLTLLLNACVGLGLLRKDSSATYANSELSEAFLVPGAPGYLGEAIRYSDDQYAAWGELERMLRAGRPAVAEQSYLGADERRTRSFVLGMHNRALGVGTALVALVDLSGRRQLLDIGGGPGTYAALFTNRYPGLRARVLDLPPVVALAGEIVASLGAAEAVDFLPGSYHDTPFPPGNDAVLISGVLHRETPHSGRDLIERAAASLVPGGLLVVSDVFVDAGGASPAFATLFGLNMALSAPDGGVHADRDVAEWIRAAGCESPSVRPFPPPMPHRVIVAVRS